MPDKFDEMAIRLLGIDRRPPDELMGDGEDHGTMSVRDLAAALRSTDAKAREEERAVRRAAERFAGCFRDVEYGREGPSFVLEASGNEAIAALGGLRKALAAVREGADACGTCRGTGRIVPHFDAPEDDCPNARSVGVPGMDDCRSCGCEEVPCPACRVVGVDLAVPGSDFTVKLEGAPGELRHAADCPCPACQGGDDAE